MTEDVYQGNTPAKYYIQRLGELYELPPESMVIATKIFTDWLAVEREAGEPIGPGVLAMVFMRAAGQTAEPWGGQLKAAAGEILLQDPATLRALDEYGVDR